MPDDRFADAVKPALEALLSDLQHTTEVLRRANLGDSYSQSREDLEPIYQEQTRRASRNGSYANDLDDIERMVHSYSDERNKEKRRSYDETHSPRNSVQQAPRPTVQSLLNELDETMTR
ncbi:unnamed protein product [Auanema sp. JU1783]|nr:unnamed protein product [Auanema sp. JU1783]